MNMADYDYLEVGMEILTKGERREDERTGTGAISLFSPPEMRFDLTDGKIPLLTTKKLHIPSIVHELIWFMRGDTDIKYLLDNNVNIWNEDAYRDYREKGGEASKEDFIENAKINGYDLGPIYGKQWRDWEGLAKQDGFTEESYIDQIADLIEALKANPQSRRHLVSAWNVSQLSNMALPPCHIFFQCYVSNDGGLSLKLYQRSADFFLGVPFNIASYSILTCLLAQAAGLYPKEFIHTIGDAHIYYNHIPQFLEQAKREPRETAYIELRRDITNIDEFTAEDIHIFGYDPHPAIKGKVSVG